MSVNSITIVGRVGQEPEVRFFFESGNAQPSSALLPSAAPRRAKRSRQTGTALSCGGRPLKSLATTSARAV